MKNRRQKTIIKAIRFYRTYLHPVRSILIQAVTYPGTMSGARGKSSSFMVGTDRRLPSLLSILLLVTILAIGMCGRETVGHYIGPNIEHLFSFGGEPSEVLIGDNSVREGSGQALAQLEKEQQRNIIYARNSRELIDLLKDHGLWDMSGKTEVPSVLVSAFPEDLGGVTVELKKKAFINSLLPAVTVVMGEVLQERRELLDILDELGGYPEDLIFSDNYTGWQEALAQGEVSFLRELTRKYRTQKASELLIRVNVLPISLIIAQGAIESSWGGSRFASEANNLFGMWTWGKKGLVPARREAGKTHKIAIYDSILDSVRAYMLTINRVMAYEDLRTIRTTTRDPFLISEGLLNYSARKELYVSDIKRIIDANDLKSYDKFGTAAG